MTDVCSFSFTVRPDPNDAMVQPGCAGACIYIPDTTYKNVVNSLCSNIPRIEDYEIKTQVMGFCSALSVGLANIQPGIKMDQMYIEICEDEAYAEWIFDNFRFGYSFHHNMDDSFWFMIAKDSDNETTRFKGDFKAGYAPVIDYSLRYIRSNA